MTCDKLASPTRWLVMSFAETDCSHQGCLQNVSRGLMQSGRHEKSRNRPRSTWDISEPRAECPVLYRRLPRALHFTHGSVLRSVLTSQLIPPLKKMCFLFTIEYYSVIERNGTRSLVEIWTALESDVQSEVSHKEKTSVYLCIYVGSRKKAQMNLFVRQQ